MVQSVRHSALRRFCSSLVLALSSSIRGREQVAELLFRGRLLGSAYHVLGRNMKVLFGLIAPDRWWRLCGSSLCEGQSTGEA